MAYTKAYSTLCVVQNNTHRVYILHAPEEESSFTLRISFLRETKSAEVLSVIYLSLCGASVDRVTAFKLLAVTCMCAVILSGCQIQ